MSRYLCSSAKRQGRGEKSCQRQDFSRRRRRRPSCPSQVPLLLVLKLLFSLSDGPHWPPDLSKLHTIDRKTKKKNGQCHNRTDLHFNASLMARHLEEKGIFCGPGDKSAKPFIHGGHSSVQFRLGPRHFLMHGVLKGSNSSHHVHKPIAFIYLLVCTFASQGYNCNEHKANTLQRETDSSLCQFVLQLAGRHCWKPTK